MIHLDETNGSCPSNTLHWTNAGLMLVQRQWRWPTINPVVFAGGVFSVAAEDDWTSGAQYLTFSSHANTKRRSNASFLLAHHLRRGANNGLTLVERRVFAGSFLWDTKRLSHACYNQGSRTQDR